MNDSPPKDGACKGKPTEWWFPLLSKGGQSRTETRFQKQQAIAICFTCKNRVACLEYSLANEPFGIWGGKDEYERDVIRRQRGVPSIRIGMITVPGRGSKRVATNVQPHE